MRQSNKVPARPARHTTELNQPKSAANRSTRFVGPVTRTLWMVSSGFKKTENQVGFSPVGPCIALPTTPLLRRLADIRYTGPAED